MCVVFHVLKFTIYIYLAVFHKLIELPIFILVQCIITWPIEEPLGIVCIFIYSDWCMLM